MRRDWRFYFLVGLTIGLLFDAVWIPLSVRLGLIDEMPFGVVCGVRL